MKEKTIKMFKEIFVPMSDEQEKGYLAECASNVIHYERFFLVFIIGFQLYNIAYALIYTKGTLNTQSSRVYTILYSILLAVSVAFLFLSLHMKKSLPKTAKAIVNMSYIYGVFILFWSACITIYDQRVSDNISVYMIVALSVAVLICFKPLHAMLSFTSAYIFLLCLLPSFSNHEHDNYGRNINLTVMSIMCILICIYRNRYERKLYLNRQIIMESNTRLEKLASLDEMTGLNNRRFLYNERNTFYEQCKNEDAPITFMMIDIDSFKNYNDTFGHLQGDECLRRMTWRIKKELTKENEYLIRYGGEEFLYIGIGIDEHTAKARGTYFTDIIRELVIGPSESMPMNITISVGTYTAHPQEYIDNGNSWAECIDKADKALYVAKSTGKDKCVNYLPVFE